MSESWLRVIVMQGRIQDFFQEGVQNTSCIRKLQVISGGGGAHPLHPPPRSAPVMPAMVHPNFELLIERDEIRKAPLIKQETELIQLFCSFLLIRMLFLGFWSNSHRGRLLDRGRSFEGGT